MLFWILQFLSEVRKGNLLPKAISYEDIIAWYVTNNYFLIVCLYFVMCVINWIRLKDDGMHEAAESFWFVNEFSSIFSSFSSGCLFCLSSVEFWSAKWMELRIWIIQSCIAVRNRLESRKILELFIVVLLLWIFISPKGFTSVCDFRKFKIYYICALSNLSIPRPSYSIAVSVGNCTTEDVKIIVKTADLGWSYTVPRPASCLLLFLY